MLRIGSNDLKIRGIKQIIRILPTVIGTIHVDFNIVVISMFKKIYKFPDLRRNQNSKQDNSKICTCGHITIKFLNILKTTSKS